MIPSGSPPPHPSSPASRPATQIKQAKDFQIAVEKLKRRDRERDEEYLCMWSAVDNSNPSSICQVKGKER